MNSKEEIIKTRAAGLGSSDAKMVAKIGKNGGLSDADRQRIAIMLGLEEKKEFRSIPTDYGNFIEEKVFEIIREKYPNVVSNPFYKSKSLSKKYGFGIFCHIDYEVELNSKLIWIENKATIKTDDDAYNDYFHQLAWHSVLLHEKAKSMNKIPILMLSHYHVDEYEEVFIPENFSIRIREIANPGSCFKKGLEIISESVKDFKYEPKEELYAESLPAPINEKMQQIAACIIEMKKAEKQVDEFKERMRELMSENNVKSIQNDYFRITLVGESMTTSFDKKSFEKEYPKIAEKFTRQTRKSSYINLKIN